MNPVRAILIAVGAVCVSVTAMLFVRRRVLFFAEPEEGAGARASITRNPVAMERATGNIDRALALVGGHIRFPCNAAGTAVQS